jgi:hypothetical protein
MPLEAVEGGVTFLGADLAEHALLKRDMPATSAAATTTTVVVVVVTAVVATTAAGVAASTSTISAPSSRR